MGTQGTDNVPPAERNRTRDRKKETKNERNRERAGGLGWGGGGRGLGHASPGGIAIATTMIPSSLFSLSRALTLSFCFGIVDFKLKAFRRVSSRLHLDREAHRCFGAGLFRVGSLSPPASGSAAARVDRVFVCVGLAGGSVKCWSSSGDCFLQINLAV